VSTFVTLLDLVFGPIYRRLRRRGPPLSAARLWALAAGGNLAKLNRASLTSLHNGLLPLISRHILRAWWDVFDGRTLREMVGWLASEGHRARFATLHALLAEGPHAPQARRVLREVGLVGDALVDFVWRNHARFKNGNLLAWDLARMINVARYGFSGGYIPEGEAWEIILAAARALQQEYDSWVELSDNYLLGFGYWQRGAEPDLLLAQATRWLKEDPASPWQRLPWSEPLA
jgi:hypothetical protein